MNAMHTGQQVSPATLHKVIAASAIGNFVEWFDFAVYGFLAVTIASLFFPPETSDPGAAADLRRVCRVVRPAPTGWHRLRHSR